MDEHGNSNFCEFEVFIKGVGAPVWQGDICDDKRTIKTNPGSPKGTLTFEEPMKQREKRGRVSEPYMY